MNYYYDITLNFDLEHIYEFYEWETSDFLVSVKKIPLFRVSFETVQDFLNYHIVMSPDFVQEIAHKTLVHDSSEELYASFLMSDTKNSFGVLLNSDGVVLSISKVLIYDDNNINEYMYTLKEENFVYEICEPREKRMGLRQENRLKNFIRLELNTLYEEKNMNKLKYLYYEWFQKEEEFLDVMYYEMLEELMKPMSDVLEKIYYLIRLSYHQV